MGHCSRRVFYPTVFGSMGPSVVGALSVASPTSAPPLARQWTTHLGSEGPSSATRRRCCSERAAVHAASICVLAAEQRQSSSNSSCIGCSAPHRLHGAAHATHEAQVEHSERECAQGNREHHPRTAPQQARRGPQATRQPMPTPAGRRRRSGRRASPRRLRCRPRPRERIVARRRRVRTASGALFGALGLDGGCATPTVVELRIASRARHARAECTA